MAEKGGYSNRAVDPPHQTESWTPPANCARCGARIMYREGEYPICLMCGWRDWSKPISLDKPLRI